MVHEISKSRGYQIRAAASPGRFSIRLDDHYDGEKHEILITEKDEAQRLALALLAWSLEDQPHG